MEIAYCHVVIQIIHISLFYALQWHDERDRESRGVMQYFVQEKLAVRIEDRESHLYLKHLKTYLKPQNWASPQKWKSGS